MLLEHRGRRLQRRRADLSRSRVGVRARHLHGEPRASSHGEVPDRGRTAPPGPGPRRGPNRRLDHGLSRRDRAVLLVPARGRLVRRRPGRRAVARPPPRGVQRSQDRSVRPAGTLHGVLRDRLLRSGLGVVPTSGTRLARDVRRRDGPVRDLQSEQLSSCCPRSWSCSSHAVARRESWSRG